MNINFARQQLKGNDLKFFDFAIESLKQANVNIKFYKKKYFKENDAYAAGLYSKSFRCLLVAVKTDPKEWFPVFIHEFCHFLQHMNGLLEKRFYFYYKHPIKSKKKRYEVCKSTADMELDCEKRVILICKKWKLSIDRKKYIQAANSAICFYYLLANYGQFNTNILDYVSDLMPKTLNVDHEMLLENNFDKWLKKMEVLVS